MHSLARTLSVALLALLATAPIQAEEHPARASLVAFNEQFNAYAAAHDIEGLVSLYHPDAYWIAQDALPAHGRDGVPRKTITFMSNNKGELHHSIDELFISDDGTQAVMMGVTSAAVESRGFSQEGTYIYVLSRDSEDEPWQVKVDMFNRHPTTKP